MCSHVKEVSAGQSPGRGHPLPADGTRLITHHQLLLGHQSEPGERVGREEEREEEGEEKKKREKWTARGGGRKGIIKGGEGEGKW